MVNPFKGHAIVKQGPLHLLMLPPPWIQMRGAQGVQSVRYVVLLQSIRCKCVLSLKHEMYACPSHSGHAYAPVLLEWLSHPETRQVQLRAIEVWGA